jgi:hypothetical protein
VIKRFYARFDTGSKWAYDASWHENIDDVYKKAQEKGYKVHSIRRTDKVEHDGSGFKPHFNHGLGQWIESKGQYRTELKKRGLIEMGNEKVTQKKEKKDVKIIDNDAAKTIAAMGGTITEKQVKEINDTWNS